VKASIGLTTTAAKLFGTEWGTMEDGDMVVEVNLDMAGGESRWNEKPPARGR
jgi:hypothetical protein